MKAAALPLLALVLAVPGPARGDPAPSVPASDPVSRNASPGAFQKGFTLGAWSRDEYVGAQVPGQLEALRAGGVEWVALTARWYQAERSSTAIAPHPEHSPSDESIRAVAELARARGLRVFLKPQIDLTGPGWRGEIAFSSEARWRAWFRSYEAFVSHHARLATEIGASLFCVGVELDGTRHREADWRSVISVARRAYAGPLVYAANWGRERDIAWWDALDYAGVDAYFPLAAGDPPRPAELDASWRREIGSLREWAGRIRKPVLFTEIGYRSLAGAAAEPWEWQREGRAAPEEQAALYRSALGTLWAEPWLHGLYWWQWRSAPPSDPLRDTGYTPQGKPAWDVVREFYGRAPR